MLKTLKVTLNSRGCDFHRILPFILLLEKFALVGGGAKWEGAESGSCHARENYGARAKTRHRAHGCFFF